MLCAILCTCLAVSEGSCQNLLLLPFRLVLEGSSFQVFVAAAFNCKKVGMGCVFQVRGVRTQ